MQQTGNNQSSSGKRQLGAILVEKGLVSPEQIEEALKVQVGGNRRLGYILIKMGFITADGLQNALSDQLNVPVITVDEQLRESGRRTLPKYLCRKYGVVPLSMGEHNVLHMAMTDPLDDEAIADIERYTGTVVQPLLASHKEISSAIQRHIPWSASDFFNPQVFTQAFKAALVLVVLLTFATAYIVFRDVRATIHGTISRTADSTIYKNHDLMIDITEKGVATLLGRGAYADSHYSAKFDKIDDLKSFLRTQEKNLSEEQKIWTQSILDRN